MTYLWNWKRTRRHILSHHADGEWRPVHFTLYGQTHQSRAEVVKRINRDVWPSSKIDFAIDKLDTLPICKHCEREAAKAAQS